MICCAVQGAGDDDVAPGALDLAAGADSAGDGDVFARLDFGLFRQIAVEFHGAVKEDVGGDFGGGEDLARRAAVSWRGGDQQLVNAPVPEPAYEAGRKWHPSADEREIAVEILVKDIGGDHHVCRGFLNGDFSHAGAEASSCCRVLGVLPGEGRPLPTMESIAYN